MLNNRCVIHIHKYLHLFNRWFNDTIDRFKKENLLSKKLADGLKSVNPKTPKSYISPKIHKENNPGRPVINSINYHTSEISRFVDHHLQPLVREITLYIKDTNDFINKIDNFAVPPDSFLVTMDVKSLYTSMPNNEGIASVKKNMIIIQIRPYLLRLLQHS